MYVILTIIMNKSQHGFSHIILIVLAVVLIAGALGVVFWQRMLAGGSTEKSQKPETTTFKPTVPEGWKGNYTPYWDVGFALPNMMEAKSGMNTIKAYEDSADGVSGTPVMLAYDADRNALIETDPSTDWDLKKENPNPYLTEADTKVMGKYTAYYYHTDYKNNPSPFYKEGDEIPKDFSGVIVWFNHPDAPTKLEYEFDDIQKPETLEKFLGSILIREDMLVKSQARN
jgi:hypothetical protein